MNIVKYTSYFHDGTIIDIKHKKNTISFLLESGYINPNEFDNKDLLSKSNTLIGELSLVNIKAVKVDRKPYLEILKKIYDDGEILDLDIVSNKVEFLIEWKNFPPKPRIRATSNISIEAEEIYWENDPFLNVD